MADKVTQQNVTQTNLPDYAQPYFTDLMGRADALSRRPYEEYKGDRIEGFTPGQNAAMQGIMGLNQNYGFTSGQNLTANAGLQALAAGKNFTPGKFDQSFAPSQFTAQQVNAPGFNMNDQMIDSSRFGVDPAQAAQMKAAQGSYDPKLQTFQMDPAGEFGQKQVDQYMSPYMQNVVDVQKQEAMRDAQKSQLAGNLNAGRQGTLGGARQLLAATERERNLGDQQAKIQATGTQAAYENAQQQYERDRQAGLGVASQNLQAKLGVQQLGTQTGMQMALANLSNEQQANVQNQAAQLQMQGMNAQQAMQAALANQSTTLSSRTTNAANSLQGMLANQQAGLETQRMGEQSRQFGSTQSLEAQRMAEASRQFGADLGMRGYQTAIQGGQATVQGAAQQQTSDLQRLQAQQGVGQAEQALGQQYKDQDYADFLRQRDYENEKLGYYSNIMRGLPVGLNTTSTTYAPPPSLTSQLTGAGVAAAGLYGMTK